MDDARPPASPDPSVPPDPARTGRLTREEAAALLAEGDARLAAGDLAEAAFATAASLGSTTRASRRRRCWVSARRVSAPTRTTRPCASLEGRLQVGETPSSYPAWRNIAAAAVRAGRLAGAIDAYRQAERRAPQADKAEIANRLGWLTKETGDVNAARRYFARGRGESSLLSVTTVLIASTVIVSLTAILSSEGAVPLRRVPARQGRCRGRRVLAALHGDAAPRHAAGFFVCAPVLQHVCPVSRGPDRRALVRPDPVPALLPACAAGGSIASFVFGGEAASVGASGAIFGLFGLLLASTGSITRSIGRAGCSSAARLPDHHQHPVRVRDPEYRQRGAYRRPSDGPWIGALWPPTNVESTSSFWQRDRDARATRLASVALIVPILVIGVVALAVVLGIAVGSPRFLL